MNNLGVHNIVWTTNWSWRIIIAIQLKSSRLIIVYSSSDDWWIGIFWITEKILKWKTKIISVLSSGLKCWAVSISSYWWKSTWMHGFIIAGNGTNQKWRLFCLRFTRVSRLWKSIGSKEKSESRKGNEQSHKTHEFHLFASKSILLFTFLGMCWGSAIWYTMTYNDRLRYWMQSERVQIISEKEQSQQRVKFNRKLGIRQEKI